MFFNKNVFLGYSSIIIIYSFEKALVILFNIIAICQIIIHNK